ncbi:MAG: hypothetical protein ACRC8S_19555 [Fimbriiglobus sp.]
MKLIRNMLSPFLLGLFVALGAAAILTWWMWPRPRFVIQIPLPVNVSTEWITSHEDGYWNQQFLNHPRYAIFRTNAPEDQWKSPKRFEQWLYAVDVETGCILPHHFPIYGTESKPFLRTFGISPGIFALAK